MRKRLIKRCQAAVKAMPLSTKMKIRGDGGGSGKRNKSMSRQSQPQKGEGRQRQSQPQEGRRQRQSQPEDRGKGRTSARMRSISSSISRMARLLLDLEMVFSAFFSFLTSCACCLRSAACSACSVSCSSSFCRRLRRTLTISWVSALNSLTDTAAASLILTNPFRVASATRSWAMGRTLCVNRWHMGALMSGQEILSQQKKKKKKKKKKQHRAATDTTLSNHKLPLYSWLFLVETAAKHAYPG